MEEPISKPRPEFNVTVGVYRITCIDYCWRSAGNPEGTWLPEAGIRNTETDKFELCQHGMDHERAVAMIANCLKHGVWMSDAAEHVQTVGQRYRDGRWGGDDEDRDWKRVKPEFA